MAACYLNPSGSCFKRRVQTDIALPNSQAAPALQNPELFTLRALFLDRDELQESGCLRNGSLTACEDVQRHRRSASLLELSQGRRTAASTSGQPARVLMSTLVITSLLSFRDRRAQAANPAARIVEAGQNDPDAAERAHGSTLRRVAGGLCPRRAYTGGSELLRRESARRSVRGRQLAAGASSN